MGFKDILNNSLVDFLIIFILIFGISRFRTPPGAKLGNRTAAFAMFCAVLLVVARHGIHDPVAVIITLAIGTAAGLLLAKSVNMIQIPAMVAFQHGAGGVAAFLVSFVELTSTGKSHALINEISGILGLVIGAATFSGSMIASGKLSNKLKPTPTIIRFHSPVALLILLSIVATATISLFLPQQQGALALVILIFLSVALGIIVSIRIGGADMPVLISFLNAAAGLAAAFCGMIIENKLLIACGATVTASGSILTHVMCKAMNRNLFRIFIPRKVTPAAKSAASKTVVYSEPVSQPGVGGDKNASDPISAAARIALEAKSVIIIPGYGMALAQAQGEVVALANLLIDMGKEVRFAVHPVAGRMPGHMHVLLAEAEIEYGLLNEMDNINKDFKNTDMVLIVGACDVVNPSAISVEGTPISGMPILNAVEAKHIICCNFDTNPGYSGVQNLLYEMDKTILLLGDAKETVGLLNTKLNGSGHTFPLESKDSNMTTIEKAVQTLSHAKHVIFVPGYGMALAQAQFKVVELAELLEKNGAVVNFAVHPIAGRMPGHMHVLLAEAEVNYEQLKEMDAINPEFINTDAVVVVGACDVINPAATNVENTPISGMPILSVSDARNVIVCNFDEKPGYSGVANPIYTESKTTCLFGDAKVTVTSLINALKTTITILCLSLFPVLSQLRSTL